MRKYNISRILALVCLISFTGFQTVVHAGNESDRVKANIEMLVKTKSCIGCDLAGAELIRMDLAGVNLQGADLTGAKLFLTNLSGANLQNTHLQRTSFGGADLAGADLRGADLREVDLNGAYLIGAKLDGDYIKTKPYDEEELSGSEGKTNADSTVKPKKVTGNQSAAGNGKVDVRENKTDDQKNAGKGGDTSDKKDSDKTETNKEKSKTEGVIPGGQVKENVVNDTTTNVKPKDISTKEKTLLPEDRENARILAQEEKSQNVEQEKTKKEELSSTNAAVQGKSVVEKDVVIAKQKEKEKNNSTDTERPTQISSDTAKNLKKLLESKKCYKCDLAGVDLSGKDLDQADLEGANLKGSNLERTDLTKANLRGASFVNANLKHADLKEADLYKADMSGADLTDAKLENSKIDETVFVGAIGRNK